MLSMILTQYNGRSPRRQCQKNALFVTLAFLRFKPIVHLDSQETFSPSRIVHHGPYYGSLDHSSPELLQAILPYKWTVYNEPVRQEFEQLLPVLEARSRPCFEESVWYLGGHGLKLQTNI